MLLKISKNSLHRNAFLSSLVLGLGIWVLDALFDHLYFYQGETTFINLLILDIPPHELFIRSSILVLAVCFGFISAYYLKKHTESEMRLTSIFNNVIPICITDPDLVIINANKSYQEIFGSIKRGSGFIKCHDSRPGPKCKTVECPLYKIVHEGKTIFTCESVKEEKDGRKQYFVVTATPYLDNENNIIGIIETFQDITPRKLLEEQREELIFNLLEEQEKVKMLSGFLPICASCKKIRDDKGYWNQIESYIKEHSEAEFSHSICPDCAGKLYGSFMKNNKHDS